MAARRVRRKKSEMAACDVREGMGE